MPLCFFGAALLPLVAMPLGFAADGAFVAVKLFGDFGDGALAGQILDRVSFVLGQLRVAHMESCTSNPNPPSSENG